MRASQNSMVGTLDEMPNSGKRKLVESMSRRKTGHQVEGWGCHPTVKSSDPELFLYEGSAGTKMEKRMKERRSSGRLKQRPGALILTLMLW